MEKGKIEFDDPTFRPQVTIRAGLFGSHECQMVNYCKCGANRGCSICGQGVGASPCPCSPAPKFHIIHNECPKCAESKAERQAQAEQFKILIDCLGAGDITSVRDWLLGAVKTLERQA